VRTPPVSFLALVWVLGFGSAHAQEAARKKPPVGVPQGAQLFDGKWYHVYLERMSWRNARDKCKRLGGQLAVVPDEATGTFLRELSEGLELWLGATDEKVEGLWMWVDGTKMTYKNWSGEGPDNSHGREHFLTLSNDKGLWNDVPEDHKRVVGYICQWKDR
jgi:hypothetical protein